MTQKHTPLPWRVREHPADVDEFHISAATPTDHPYFESTKEIEIMSDERYPTKRADAEFIVQAVNAHEGLLAALERLMSLQYHCDYSDVPDPEVCPGDPPEDPGPCHWCEARAAIDKATSLQAPGP